MGKSRGKKTKTLEKSGKVQAISLGKKWKPREIKKWIVSKDDYPFREKWDIFIRFKSDTFLFQQI